MAIYNIFFLIDNPVEKKESNRNNNNNPNDERSPLNIILMDTIKDIINIIFLLICK